MRRTPLARGSSQLARTPLARMSVRRRRANVQRRRNVLEAFGDQPDCFVCGQPADDAHELLSRGRGGSITDVKNIRPACRRCHNEITCNPRWAEAAGFALPTQRTEETA